MERSRDPSTFGRPDVVVEFEFEKGWFFLAITNVGSQPAHSISTSFEPSFSGLGGCREIPRLNLFDTIGFLSPGKAIRTFVDDAESYFAREEPAVIQTEVAFRDDDGRPFTNSATHDLDIYRDLPHLLSDTPSTSRSTAGGVPPSWWDSPRRSNPSEDPTDVPARRATFELYEDRGGEYRWRLVHPNGNIIADSGEGYASKQSAKQGIASVQENAGIAGVEDHT